MALRDQNPMLSTSSIHKTSIVNTKHEDLGSIKDIMIDMSSGEVVYVVVSFGGFLGIGDKLFAVPLEAFEIDTEHERFILDVSQEKLENAPGFDKDNWPSSPQTDFLDEVYAHYGYGSYANRRQRAH